MKNQRFFNRKFVPCGYKFAGCEKGRGISMKEVFFRLGRMKFIRCFQLCQMMRERRTGFTVVCGMMMSLLVLMLGLNCYVLCGNVEKDTMNSIRFEYMYLLKYPIKEIPEGGEACYVESLSKTAMGYTLNVSVIGIDEDNKYYGTEPMKGKAALSSVNPFSRNMDSISKIS